MRNCHDMKKKTHTYTLATDLITLRDFTVRNNANVYLGVVTVDETDMGVTSLPV